jgi:hypothetical protein
MRFEPELEPERGGAPDSDHRVVDVSRAGVVYVDSRAMPRDPAPDLGSDDHHAL